MLQQVSDFIKIAEATMFMCQLEINKSDYKLISKAVMDQKIRLITCLKLIDKYSTFSDSFIKNVCRASKVVTGEARFQAKSFSYKQLSIILHAYSHVPRVELAMDIISGDPSKFKISKNAKFKISQLIISDNGDVAQKLEFMFYQMGCNKLLCEGLRYLQYKAKSNPEFLESLRKKIEYYGFNTKVQFKMNF